MTAMSRLIFVETKTAQRVGVDVPVMPITDAFPSGCFAMARMIVVTVPMRKTKIVHRAKKKEISVAETEGVFQNDGCVISKTIAVTTPMRVKKLVQDAIANVRNPSSSAATTNVFRADGNVITMTIAETEVTKPRAKLTNVPRINFNVNLATVSKRV